MQNKKLGILPYIAVATTSLAATCYRNIIQPCPTNGGKIEMQVSVNGVQETIDCTGTTTDSRLQAVGETTYNSTWYATYELVSQPCNYSCQSQSSDGNWHTLMRTGSQTMPLARGLSCPNPSGGT